MTVTVCLYILFIMVVLSISFPLKSRKAKISNGNTHENSIGLVNDEDANKLGDSEQKLIQRAHNLPAISNRSDVLRDAFQR